MGHYGTLWDIMGHLKKKPYNIANFYFYLLKNLKKVMKKKWIFALGGISLLGICAWVYGKYSSTINTVKGLKFSPLWNGGIDDMKITLSTVKLPLAVDISNRSDSSLSFTINSVDVYKDGETIASTPAKDFSCTLDAYATTRMPLDVEVSNTYLLSLIGGNILNIINKNFSIDAIKNEFNDLKIRCDITAFGVRQPLIFDMEGNEVTLDGIGYCPNLSNRVIGSKKDYEDYIADESQLRHDDKILIKNVQAEETASFMRQIVKKTTWQTLTLSSHLAGNNEEETVKNVFDFVFKYIKYEPDDEKNEQLRSPLRTLHDQKGDCDCMALLIASIFENLDIKYKIRIAEYENRGYFQHVYIVAIINGKEYPCDPVTDFCYYQKQYTEKKDF